MTAGFLLWSASCSAGGGAADPGAELARLDLGDLGVTPWAIMHLQLLFADEQSLVYHGETTTLAALLRADLGGLPAVWRDPRGAPPATPLYFFEGEDHWGQLWAYRAEGMADRGVPEGDPEWRTLLAAYDARFLEARDEENSWMIILGGVLAVSVTDRDERARVLESLAALVRAALEVPLGDPSLACGGTHQAVALAISSQLPWNDPALKRSIDERLDQFRHGLDLLVRPDGYFPLAGLHTPFGAIDTGDWVRVLGHVAEFYSYLGTALAPAEERVFFQLEPLVKETPAASREVGELAHAVAALRRHRRVREAG